MDFLKSILSLVSRFKFLTLLGLTSLILFSTSAKAFQVYLPEKFNKATARMVVAIHGCLQTPESFSLGTGWSELAEIHNLIVLYPRVPNNSHPLGCWSWYLPENQKAGGGQLQKIIDEITDVKSKYELGQIPIFVAGMSSGAAMVANLLACYPNVFKAGAIHSGVSYGQASRLSEAEEVLKDGPQDYKIEKQCRPKDFKGGLIVLHGKSDSVVNPKNATQVIVDFVSDKSPISSSERKVEGVTYKINDYAKIDGSRGRLIEFDPLGHEWSGIESTLKYQNVLKEKAPTKLPFFVNTGPSSTLLVWDFFKNFSFQ